ncbi:MAG: hypothetical protein K2X46_04505, partial [Roseomonas sp.]|nr:hypothetical protein [Roseomonas sp.]
MGTWLLALLLLLLFVAPARAGDRIVARAYLEDPAGLLTFEEARRGTYTPYTGVLNRGYSPSAFWLRLTVNADEGTGPQTPLGHLVLRVRPAFLDEAELFDPIEPRAAPRRTGDRHPWNQDEARTVTPGFILPLGAGTRDVWLRMRTTSSAIIDVTALPPDEAARAEANLLLGASAYIGAMTLLAFWGLLQYVLVSRFVAIVFFAKQVAATILSLGSFGHSRFLLDGIVAPATIDALTSAATVALVCTGLAFHAVFLQPYRPARWTMVALTFLVSLGPVGFVLFALDATQFAIALNAKAATLGITITLVAAATTKRHNTTDPAGPGHGGYIRKPLLVGLSVAEVVGVLLITLPLLGVVTSPTLTLVNVQIWILFSGFMMMAALQLETLAAIRERNAATIRATTAER